MKVKLSILAACFATVCVAMFSYPGDLPENMEMSKVVLNIESFDRVAEECGKWGLYGVAGCTCFTEDLKPQPPGPQTGCFVPVGKVAIIWTVDDPETIKHKLAHAAYGSWH